MFLDIEILDNSFSLPGAKAAFIFLCACRLGVPSTARSENGRLFKPVWWWVCSLIYGRL